MSYIREDLVKSTTVLCNKARIIIYMLYTVDASCYAPSSYLSTGYNSIIHTPISFRSVEFNAFLIDDSPISSQTHQILYLITFRGTHSSPEFPKFQKTFGRLLTQIFDYGICNYKIGFECVYIVFDKYITLFTVIWSFSFFPYTRKNHHEVTKSKRLSLWKCVCICLNNECVCESD